MVPGLAEQIAVEKVSHNEFVSKLNPIRMGNPQPIAYGGSTLAIAVNAACETVPPGFSPYSILGHFLGPASTDQKLHCSVQEIRNTRSFVTRRVQVKQKQPDETYRNCIELTADFHVHEPSTAADYSAGTATTWPRPDDCPLITDRGRTLVERGVVTQEQLDTFNKTLGTVGDYFETRSCPNGVSAQNMSGAAKDAVTTQDRLPITSKVSAEWHRVFETLRSEGANLSAAAFLMDGSLSFLPLTHGNRWFEDVGACSTLDFALRLFTPKVEMDRWHLKERWTIHGGHGRTFSEARLWGEKGELVASMTQQCILRPPEVKKSAKSKM